MTPDTSGPASSPPFAWYDRETSCWRTSQGTFLSGSDEFSATWPKSGMTRDGYAYELPTPALPTAEPASSSSLPTPRATRGGSGTETMYALGGQRTDAGRTQGEVLLPTPVADHSRGLPQPGTDYASLPNAVISLLPTPVVNDMGAGKTPEAWDAWTEKMRASHGNGNGHGPSLSIEVARLLPTPQAHDAQGSKTPEQVAKMRAKGHGVRNLNETAEHELSGEPTSPPSADGRPSSDDQLPGQLSLDDVASD